MVYDLYCVIYFTMKNNQDCLLGYDKLTLSGNRCLFPCDQDHGTSNQPAMPNTRGLSIIHLLYLSEDKQTMNRSRTHATGIFYEPGMKFWPHQKEFRMI